LFLTIHHIVLDGWSANILLRDLDELESAERTGRPIPPPRTELQFSDYAAWQNAWRGSWDRVEQVRFWRQELAGSPTYLDLPSTLPRPGDARFERGLIPLSWTEEISTGIRGLASAEGATTYTVLTAAYALLLSRLTGAHELVIATPVASRPQEELEHLVGLFANLVPLRIDLLGAETFTDIMRRVRTAARRSFAHSDLAIEDLIEELRPSAPPNVAPLAQMIVALYNYPQHDPRSDLAADALEKEPSEALQIYSPTSVRPDICIRIFDRAGGAPLAGLVEYNRLVIDGDSAERMFDAYIAIVREVVAAPGTRLEQHRALSNLASSG
jgi:hypothetical protein